LIIHSQQTASEIIKSSSFECAVAASAAGNEYNNKSLRECCGERRKKTTKKWTAAEDIGEER
jgi:hypothetical protein